MPKAASGGVFVAGESEARFVPKMMIPLVRELAADGITVAVTCRVLKFSRQAFYAWSAVPVCDRDVDDAVVTNAAVDVHRDDPEFGYRFIAGELVAAGHSEPSRLSCRWFTCGRVAHTGLVGQRSGRFRIRGV
jgi:putative transposase